LMETDTYGPLAVDRVGAARWGQARPLPPVRRTGSRRVPAPAV